MSTVSNPGLRASDPTDEGHCSEEHMISRGSEWHRWEPQIHAPGTILNNQFGANDPWGAYLTTLETQTSKIEAIAVTDYYVTDAYERFLTHKATGRLPDVKLIFPNIELRLDVRVWFRKSPRPSQPRGWRPSRPGHTPPQPPTVRRPRRPLRLHP
jgi:hypothetical protein